MFSFVNFALLIEGDNFIYDTLIRPPFWDLLMLQLLRPNSSNLPCLYSTFHLEYPLVLSRFYLVQSVDNSVYGRPVIVRARDSKLVTTTKWLVGGGDLTSGLSNKGPCHSSLHPPDCIRREGIVVSACVFMSALCGPYFQRPL